MSVADFDFTMLNQTSPLAGLATDAKGADRGADRGKGAPGQGPQGFTLREFWPFVATQIAWSKGQGPAVAKALDLSHLPETAAQGYVEAGDGTLFLPLMPDRVLRFGATPLGQGQLAGLGNAGAYTLDLTQGRVLLGLRGAAWRWTLMKGGGLDFDALNVGAVAQTTLFKISTLIWVVEPNEVRLLVPYTFARALAEKILDAGSDQGLSYVGAQEG